MVLVTWLATVVCAAAYAWTVWVWPKRWIRLAIGAAVAALWLAVAWSGYMGRLWELLTFAFIVVGTLFILVRRSD